MIDARAYMPAAARAARFVLRAPRSAMREKRVRAAGARRPA